MQLHHMLHIQFRQLTQGHYLARQQVLRDLVIHFAQVNGLDCEFNTGVPVRPSQVNVARRPFA